MIFPVIFAALYASRFSLLRLLPYYWDEAGYYIPACVGFLFRTGSLIPITTGEQCSSAAAQHLPGAVVEGFRLFSRGHARSGPDRRVVRIARRVAARSQG